MRIVIFGNEYQKSHLGEIPRLFDILRKYDVTIAVEKNFYKYLHCKLAECPEADEVFADDSDYTADIALSIGGDGTFLRTARSVALKNIPILGINTGSLGFLADVRVCEMEKAADDIFNSRYTIESRTLLEVSTSENVKIAYPYALNEVAILKAESSSMIRMNAEVNGAPLTTYMGDGLLISTPTGSTAYNLSVGGPILEPSSRSIALSPIAAHSITMRPVVMNDTCEIKITTSCRSKNYRLSIDGKSFTLPEGSSIEVKKAQFNVKMVQIEGHTFASTLRNKLMWGIDAR